MVRQIWPSEVGIEDEPGATRLDIAQQRGRTDGSRIDQIGWRICEAPIGPCVRFLPRFFACKSFCNPPARIAARDEGFGAAPGTEGARGIGGERQLGVSAGWGPRLLNRSRSRECRDGSSRYVERGSSEPGRNTFYDRSDVKTYFYHRPFS